MPYLKVVNGASEYRLILEPAVFRARARFGSVPQLL